MCDIFIAGAQLEEGSGAGRGGGRGRRGETTLSFFENQKSALILEKKMP